MQQTISFNSLPIEIRQHILTFTDLVAPDHVCVQDGRPLSFVPYEPENEHEAKHWEHCQCPRCSKPYFGLNLLNVRNKSFRDDAHYIFFSRNWFGFSRHTANTLRFLQEKQPWIRHLRSVRFFFSEMQIDRWITNGRRIWPAGCPCPPFLEPPGHDTAWREIARLIKDNVPLENLHITLDAWEANQSYIQSRIENLSSDNIVDTYKDIIQPLKGWGGLGLKGFWAIWAFHFYYEQEAEEEVMGPGYTTSGKETPDSRW